MQTIIDHDKQRIIRELISFMSLEPSELVKLECDAEGKAIDLTKLNIRIVGLQCRIGKDNFIRIDNRIIYAVEDYVVDGIEKYKNSDILGITFEEACVQIEKRILESTQPRTWVSMQLMSDKPFNWVKLVCGEFKVYKKNTSIKNEDDVFEALRVGYYHQTKDDDLSDGERLRGGEPYFQHIEEITRYVDNKCLHLFACIF